MLQGVDKDAFTAFKQPSLAESSTARTNTVSEPFRDYSQNKYLHNENQEPRYKIDEMGVKTNIAITNKVRLAFFFTVYSDAAFVLRLFSKLYSPTHYYLFHIDNSVGGVSSEFLQTMRQLTANHSNVHLCKDVPIVYGASTATILLTKAMHWFDKHATGWDYFVPLTGSDYPLVPLRRIEEIFAFQQPPMPFVMAWTPGIVPMLLTMPSLFSNSLVCGVLADLFVCVIQIIQMIVFFMQLILCTARYFHAHFPIGKDSPGI